MWEPLLKEATPALYRENAFRVLDLSVDISYRSAVNRMQELRLQAQYGHAGGVPSSGESPELELLKIQDRLNNSAQRFIDEIFWIWPLEWGSDGQSSSPESLDWQEQLNLWEKMASSNYVAAHNLAVYHHAKVLQQETESKASPTQTVSSLDGGWKTSLQYWKQTLEDEHFWQQVARRAQAHQLNVPIDEEFRKSLKMAIALTGARLELQQAERDGQACLDSPHPWRQHFFDATIIPEALEHAAQGILSTLKAFCQGTAQEIAGSPLSGAQSAWELLRHALPKYALLTHLPCGQSLVREAIWSLNRAVCECLRKYEEKTEDWDTCIQILTMWKGRIPAESIPQDLKLFLQRLEKDQQEGNRWYAPDYWSLPKEVVQTLERAKEDMEAERWDTASRTLRPLTSSPDAGIRRAARIALAQCLKRKTVRAVNSLVAEIHSLSDQIENIRNALGDFGFRIALLTNSSLDTLIDKHNRAVRELKAKLPGYFQTLLEARQLNPLNQGISENLRQLQDLAGNADVQLSLTYQRLYVVWEVSPPNDPSEEKCWFCGQAEGSSSSNLKVAMSSEEKKTSIPWGERWEHEQMGISVPRCQQCRFWHDRIQAQVAPSSILWGILGGVLSGFAAFTYASMNGITDFVPLVGLSGFLGLLVSIGFTAPILSSRSQKILSRLGIKPLSALGEYPGIKEKQKQRWKLGDYSWSDSKEVLRFPKRSPQVSPSL